MLLRKNKVSMAVMRAVGSRDDYKSAVAMHCVMPRLAQAADSLGYVLGSPMSLKEMSLLCH